MILVSKPFTITAAGAECKGVQDPSLGDTVWSGGKVGSPPCLFRNFFRNVTVQQAVLRRGGRQSAIGGPRPGRRVVTLTAKGFRAS